jgi:hypothetical protein
VRTRLAWAFGGFVVFALVVYRFLTRGPAPAAAEQAAGAAATAAATAAAGDAAPEQSGPAAAEPVAEEPVAAPSGTAVAGDETDASDGAAADASDDDDDQVPGDPDERVAELRRKLELAREAEGQPAPSVHTREADSPAAPSEPPLDDRRRAVHDAGRTAAETMRRTADDPRRSSGSGPGPGAPGAGSGSDAG